jgi:hypothetical protein
MMTLASMVHALDLATVLPVPLAWRAHPAIFQGAIGMLYGRDVVRVPTHVPGAGIPVAEGLAPWLLGAVRRAGTESALSAGAPFTRVDPFEVTWTPGPPTLPTPQAVTLVAEDPTLHRALFGERVALQSADVAAAGGAWAVVLVHGRPHGKPTEAATCGPWTLYSTGHALAAHQRETDHHAWILASLRGAHPQKASLEQIDCQDALVFVEPTRDKDARELLVVHIDTGRIGRMPLAPDDRWWVHRPTSELQKTGAVYSMDSLHQQLSAPID